MEPVLAAHDWPLRPPLPCPSQGAYGSRRLSLWDYPDHRRVVRWLPCIPGCGNWLRYGIQPRDAGPGLRAGSCPSKAHDGEHLGLGGRRVLVSRRKWTDKTLDVHRADRAAVVRQVLEEASQFPHPGMQGSQRTSRATLLWSSLARGATAVDRHGQPGVRRRGSTGGQARERAHEDGSQEETHERAPELERESA